MKLTENFNSAKLQALINNKDHFKINDETFERMTTYMNWSINDTLNVHYSKVNGQGRRCAFKGVSMQMLSKAVRHTIADNKYMDIDIENAHPVILQHICKNNNIPCDKLTHYINNRNKILDVSNRDFVKNQYLVYLNNDNKIDEISNIDHIPFALEMNSIRNKICDIYSNDFNSFQPEENKNKKTSFMAIKIQSIEDDILMKMYSFFGSPNDCVLCYDGLMIPKNKYDLTKCQEYIKSELNIDIKLAEKKMDKGYDLSSIDMSNITYNKQLTYQDINKFIGQEVYHVVIDNWINNNVMLLDDHGKLIFVIRYPKSYHLVKHSDFSTTSKSMACKVFDPNVTWKENKKNPELVGQMKPFPHLGVENGYLKHCIDNNKITRYYSVEYYPHLKSVVPKLDKGSLNLFTGYPLDTGIYDNTDIFLNSKFMHHLKDSFFRNDEKLLDHFLDSIADMIQDATDIKSTGYLFYSKQGCGKGTLAKFMQKLLGYENVYKFENSDLYFESRFNADCTNKILKIFEEVSEKGKAFNNHNRLKAEMAMESERIEHKGINPVSVRHCARYWFFTNNRNALFVEDDDRRLTFVDVSDKHKQDNVYFKQIIDEVNDEAFMKSAFNFFASRKYDKLTVLKAHTTDYKISQKLANISNGVQFMIDHIKENYDSVQNKDIKITQAKMKILYKDWCDSSGVKYNMRTLETQLLNIGIGKPTRTTIDDKRVLSYIINIQEIQNNISSRIEGFKFFDDDQPVKKDNNVKKAIKKVKNKISIYN